MSDTYSFGIEEEYFVYSLDTRDAQPRMLPAFFEQATSALGKRVSREMLQAQIEIGTTPCTSFTEARSQLIECRRTLQDLGALHGLGILASATHPIADWVDQHPTEKPRYGKVTDDLQMIARRELICGMHVHVEVPAAMSRVNLMGRVLPYLPLLLALSTSSPFWQSRATGLMSYRQSVYAEIPRSGLPDLFEDESDYAAFVGTLVDNHVIPDASYLWWVIRPSIHFPTLELRVLDVCTDVEDALAVAALYRCLIRHLCEDQSLNRGMNAGKRAIVEENKWRAQRYGIHGSLIDLDTGEARPIAAVLRDVLVLLGEDAAALGCASELEHTRSIPERGTSADMQLAVYSDLRASGGSHAAAMAEVVDWVARKTAATPST